MPNKQSASEWLVFSQHDLKAALAKPPIGKGVGQYEVSVVSGQMSEYSTAVDRYTASKP